MSEPIISVSGLRGIVGDSLTPELAMRFAVAFSAGLLDGPVVVTRDGRTTGQMVADVVRGALAAAGRDVIDGGIAATPTTGVLVRQFQAAGGIQISASHNPPQYNGLKLFDSDGRVLTQEVGEHVVQRFRGEEPVWVEYQQVGSVQACEDTLSRHAELVLANVDVPLISKRRFHVLLDSNHGAGSLLGRHLLERLGCQVTLLGGLPDGRFAHTPEPTAENLKDVRRHVTESGAAVGFCQDPDADRLAVIDEQGRYIGEEFTLALCLDHVLEDHPGPVVTNCATSRMAEDIARKYHVPCFRSAVGEANVVATMLEQEAVFGGEGNGGPIDPRVGYVRDSFVGMALILDAMAARQQPISALADQLPQYAIHKSKVTLDRTRIAAALDTLEQHFAQARADRLDGLRLDLPGRWLLVRASNTEPIVRIIAEAESADAAQQLCEEAASVIK